MSTFVLDYRRQMLEAPTKLSRAALDIFLLQVTPSPTVLRLWIRHFPEEAIYFGFYRRWQGQPLRLGRAFSNAWKTSNKP